MTDTPQVQQAEQAQDVKRRKASRVGPIFAGLITTGVGAAAGYVSWQHLSHLGEKVGATAQGAFLTPITIDGMILAGTLELRQARREHRPAKPWAYGAVLIGVVGTIAGNIAASTQTSLTARLYFAAPALAFLISVEVLFGKPLSRNLWELLHAWWANRPSRKAVRQAATTAPAEPVKAPKPDRPGETAKPVEDPTPDRPVKAPEKAAEGRAPRLVPALPETPRTPATRKAGRGARRVPAAAKVTGSRTRPAREVDGKVLEGEALRADARWRIRRELAAGQKRSGAWVAQQYDPPMSDRWGLERLAEVPAVPEAEPSGPVDATGLMLIDPEVPMEHAVPINGTVDREPAGV